MKKTFLTLIGVFLTCFTFAQQENQAARHADPSIRTDRKELKREHYADRPVKNELHIHRNKHELHHGRGKQHEWNHNHHTRPVKKSPPRKKRPMTDRRNK